ncbi:beta-lactamase/transpeptidase-like protein [Apiosordaria backusii]|uniref:Beta-lactamase/transpeptidase-like protein n=1 Tax=Apiosordaria backusii TaxID=314023 RepID=A0AA40BN64_9PEZI|nr:beta-lactamase/transpeptidase-like protein [Apiosordaria backusii]
MRFLTIFALAIGHSVTALECHSDPILPPARNLGQSEAFQNALSGLTQKLDAAAKGDILAGWDINNTSMSVGIVSFDQENPNVPIWEYHHLAPGNVNGTKRVDKNSQYLIGSVSKVITDALVLRSGVDIDEPVTSFIPQLAGESLIQWGDIALRDLAEQLAGIPTNYGFSEYYYINFYFELLGFPPVENSSYPPCGVIGLNKGCSKDELLQGLLASYPTTTPQTHPVYSNVAFTLLSYALTARTNTSYADLLSTLLTTPLGMSSTSPDPGNDSLAVIPPVSNSWGSTYGDSAPGGGLVSTLSDLSVFLHAILTRAPALGLSERAVQEWLKPRSFTGSRSSFVGTPWEIFRPEPELLFPDGEGHTVTIHGKGGGAYGYASWVGLVEEYGLGVVVLTAGGENAVAIVQNAVLSTLIPIADRVAREQAAARYAGVWEGSGLNATVEVDGEGLKITGLWREGKDMLQAIREIWAVTANEWLPSTLGETYRAFPAMVEKQGVMGGREVVREDWRLQWDVRLALESELPGARLAGNDCLSWTLVDWLHYGSEPIDRIVFVKDAVTGEVIGLDVPFLRTGVLEKVGGL